MTVASVLVMIHRSGARTPMPGGSRTAPACQP